MPEMWLCYGAPAMPMPVQAKGLGYLRPVYQSQV